MRIAFFTDTYLPNIDGVVTCLLNYRKEIERRGAEVFIFSPGTMKNKEENQDSHVYYFTSASFKPYPDYRIALFPFDSAVKLVKDLKIDIIHSHGIATTGLAAIQASKKLGVPAIASFHTMVPEATNYITTEPHLQGILQGIAWRYLKWYYSFYRKVVVPTAYVKGVLEKHGIGNIHIQPSGVDLSIFNENVSGEAFRKKYNLGKEPVVLHVGRVAIEKNLHMLIDAAPSIINKLPDVKFVIVGKGPAEERYKSMVKMKGLESHFLFCGFVPAELLPSAYAAGDVLAFTSFFDTQGMTVLESMAVGTPVVIPMHAAPAEFVDCGVNGYVFSDKFDLHEKILTAIEEKQKLRGPAIKKAKEFSSSKVGEEFVRLYESLIAAPQPPQKQ